MMHRFTNIKEHKKSASYRTLCNTSVIYQDTKTTVKTKKVSRKSGVH